MCFALYIAKNLLGISDEIIPSASVASWPPYRLCAVVLCTIILEILSPDVSVGFFNFHLSLLLSRFSEIHKYSNSSGTSPHIYQPIGTLKTQSLTPHSPKCISDFFPSHLIPHLFKSILPLSLYCRWQWLTIRDETWKKKVLRFGRITRNVISEVATYAERLETGLQRHRTQQVQSRCQNLNFNILESPHISHGMTKESIMDSSFRLGLS